MRLDYSATVMLLLFFLWECDEDILIGLWVVLSEEKKTTLASSCLLFQLQQFDIYTKNSNIIMKQFEKILYYLHFR